jgi:hypothetical protein
LKNGFLGTYTNSYFVKLFEDTINALLVTFDQARYGFNVGFLELYYINNELKDKSDFSFSKELMNNSAIVKETVETLAKLPDLRAKHKSFNDKIMIAILIMIELKK